jgi:non-ribosomal peptide synthetase component E (peptide arylation enzyme)
MAKPTRYTPEMIDEYTKAGYWGSTTYSEIWNRNARNYPNKEAIVDSNNRLTWEQANQLIDRIALNFLALGLRKDEMVVAQLPNCVELVLLRAACERTGLLFLPVLRNLRKNEIEYILGYTEAVCIIIPWQYRDFDYHKMIREIQPNFSKLKHVFVVGDSIPEGALPFTKMMQCPSERLYPPEYLEETRAGAMEYSLVLPTTGTTGLPKFVEFPVCSRVCSAKAFAEDFKFTSDDIFGIIGPAAAGPNVRAYLVGPLVAAKIVMMERFEAGAALDLIQREKITVVGVVPTMLAKMIEHAAFDEYDLRSLRLIYSTGADLPYQLALTAEEKIGCKIIQIYGSVDAGCGTSALPEDSQETRLLTVGKPPKGNEIKLIDENGNDVIDGNVGEIVLKGPISTSGYHKDPEATWQCWNREGWFATGDLGRIDKNGNLVFVGRKKDIIIRGGQNIYPVEVEALLIKHPKVLDVAIVGMPDQIMGERVCAYVVPRESQYLSMDEIVSYLKDLSIAPFKIPERFEILESLPMVGEQKVDKKALKQDIAQKLSSEGKQRL